MKKILAVIVGLLIFATPVIAANSFDMDVGSLPNNWKYGFKTVGENLLLAFTFSDEGKAKLHYLYGLRRMAEAEELDELGEYKHMNKLMERYEHRMQKVNDYLESLEEITDSTVELGAQVEGATEIQNRVLQRLRNKVPEEARRGIDTALESTGKVKKKIREKLRECGTECLSEMSEEEQEALSEELQEEFENQDCDLDNCAEGETCACAQRID